MPLTFLRGWDGKIFAEDPGGQRVRGARMGRLLHVFAELNPPLIHTIALNGFIGRWGGEL